MIANHEVCLVLLRNPRHEKERHELRCWFVSLGTTAICAVDENGAIIKEGVAAFDPDEIAYHELRGRRLSSSAAAVIMCRAISFWNVVVVERRRRLFGVRPETSLQAAQILASDRLPASRCEPLSLVET